MITIMRQQQQKPNYQQCISINNLFSGEQTSSTKKLCNSDFTTKKRQIIYYKHKERRENINKFKKK